MCVLQALYVSIFPRHPWTPSAKMFGLLKTQQEQSCHGSNRNGSPSDHQPFFSMLLSQAHNSPFLGDVNPAVHTYWPMSGEENVELQGCGWSKDPHLCCFLAFLSQQIYVLKVGVFIFSTFLLGGCKKHGSFWWRFLPKIDPAHQNVPQKIEGLEMMTWMVVSAIICWIFTPKLGEDASHFYKHVSIRWLKHHWT